MSELGKRLQQLRKQQNISQTNLAQKVGISYAQLSRYENKGTQPPAEVLKKIADVLGTTVDFLVSGDADQKARSMISDNELLQQFKAVEQMDEDDKSTIKKLIDAFITKRKIQQLAL